MASREHQANYRRKQAHLDRGDLEIEDHWITYEDRELLLSMRLIDDRDDPDQIKAAFGRMLAGLRKNYLSRV